MLLPESVSDADAKAVVQERLWLLDQTSSSMISILNLVASLPEDVAVVLQAVSEDARAFYMLPCSRPTLVVLLSSVPRSAQIPVPVSSGLCSHPVSLVVVDSSTA